MKVSNVSQWEVVGKERTRKERERSFNERKMKRRKKGVSTIISSVKGTGYQKEYRWLSLSLSYYRVYKRTRSILEAKKSHSASVVDEKKERKRKETLPLCFVPLCSAIKKIVEDERKGRKYNPGWKFESAFGGIWHSVCNNKFYARS